MAERLAANRLGSLQARLQERPASDRIITELSLTGIVDTWPALPEPIRRAILALIESSCGGGCPTRTNADE
jgi:hypothetical protein